RAGNRRSAATAKGGWAARLRLGALELAHEGVVGQPEALRDRHLRTPFELTLGQGDVEAAALELAGAQLGGLRLRLGDVTIRVRSPGDLAQAFPDRHHVG